MENSFGYVLGFDKEQPCKELQVALITVDLPVEDQTFSPLGRLGFNPKKEKEYYESEGETESDTYSLKQPTFYFGYAHQSGNEYLKVMGLTWESIIIHSAGGSVYKKGGVLAFDYAKASVGTIGNCYLASDAEEIKTQVRMLVEDDDENEGKPIQIKFSEKILNMFENAISKWEEYFEYKEDDSGKCTKFIIRNKHKKILQNMEPFDGTEKYFYANYDYEDFITLNKIWDARTFLDHND